MPKIIIREIDNTSTGTVEYSNFSVVVPGFCNNTIVAKGETPEKYPCLLTGNDECIYYKAKEDGTPILVFDANGVYECSSQKDFIKYIGKHKQETSENNGNQIAYELLGMGYTVLFKLLDHETEWGTAKKKGCDAMQLEEYWKCLKDRSAYDFRYICTGDYCHKDAYHWIADVATHKNETIDDNYEDTGLPGRGDCIAFIDIDETDITQKEIISKVQTYANGLTYIPTGATDPVSYLNKYCELGFPHVIYAGNQDTVYKNLTFPESFHYLACAAYARNVRKFKEWYAIAGYTRGICDRVVEKTTFKVGEIEMNALQPRKSTYDKATGKGTKYSVNVVRNIRGNYYIWGDRTAEELKEDLEASHFLPIRELCCTLKKDIYVTCNEVSFDPNTDLLWGTFCNKIRPTLEKMKANEGIGDYKFIKVKNERKALVTAKIRITPYEPVEDFDVSVYLENSISGVIADVED